MYPPVSYHFVPGVALRDFALKDAQGNKELISTNDKEPSLLKTGAHTVPGAAVHMRRKGGGQAVHTPWGGGACETQSVCSY
jgi:hypothetical protein